jgi:hypothetical protein
MHLTLLSLAVFHAYGADHLDAPAAAADPDADIADLYTWHTDGRLVIVYTWMSPPAGEANWDSDVLYGVHIDHDDDQVADHEIWIRFGQNPDGDWGVQFKGLPGSTDALEGKIDATLERDGVVALAGFRDDPFFFDLTGFQDTLATGTLSFDASRDSFAGTNVPAVVIELDAATATGDTGTAALWVTSARKGGGR